MTFRGQWEAEAWVAFVAAYATRGEQAGPEGLARWGDLMLQEYRKRWEKELSPTTDAPGPGWPPDPKREAGK